LAVGLVPRQTQTPPIRPIAASWRSHRAGTRQTTVTSAEWKAVLLKVEPRGKPWILDGLADAMQGLIERYKIDTPLRQQHFIAQVAHESDHFQTTTEYASGAAYEGRKDLGNTQKGDGKLFRGRGLIQLTGRANYTSAQREFGQPFVANPDMVAHFPWAADVSGWFWSTHNLNEHADRDDVRAVTKIINGGLTGLPSRQAALARARVIA
jgi:putative chitinase